MKKKKLFFTFLCLILAFRQTVTEGVTAGIKLSIYSVLPSLLPFMLITNIMIKYDLCQYISYLFQPVLSKLFKISSNGCFALIIGFTCGYPMGAKVIGDLYRENKLSHSEACYLITFCNNSTITFLINYILYLCLQHEINAFALIFLIYFPALITGFINQFLIKPDITYISPVANSKTDNGNPILDTIKSLGILSMYVICFSVISQWIASLNFIPDFLQKLIMGLTEITSGAHFICSGNSINIYEIFLVILCSIFGGMSILFQSFAQLPDIKLKIYYVIGKLETIMWGAILFFILYFIGLL